MKQLNMLKARHAVSVVVLFVCFMFVFIIVGSLLIDNRRSGIGSSSFGLLGNVDDCSFFTFPMILTIP